MLPSTVASAYLSYPAHYMHKNAIAEPFFISPQGNYWWKLNINSKMYFGK